MRIFTVLLAIAAGVAASQAPEFAQQYRQRLGGAVDELQRIIQNFDADATAAGHDRAGALAVFARDGEQVVRDTGLRMAEIIVRHARLIEQQRAFAEGPPFQRLVAFAQDFDRPLVEATLRDYEPAVPTTVEGGAFAAAGFIGIYFVLRFLGSVLLWRPRWRHSDRTSSFIRA